MKRQINQLKLVLRDNNKKKPLFQIIKELFSYTIRKKESPTYYFAKYLYRADTPDYRNFLSLKEERLVNRSVKYHPRQLTSLIANKLSFALHFEHTDLSIPRLLAYNINSFFSNMDNKSEKITTQEEFKGFLINLLDQNDNEDIFVKPVYGSNGKGCFILNKENLEEVVSTRWYDCLEQGCLYQEKIVQHAEVNKIYPHSVNTLRIETYLDKSGKTHVLSSFMRFGSGGHVVDNNGSGGFTAPVDVETGTLKGMGLQPLWGGKGGGYFKEHPDTNFPLKDFKIPYFEEACKLALAAVECLPLRYIGWDIAIGSDAPVIIEGNSTPVIKGGDVAYGGYMKNPIYTEILEEA